MTTLPPYKGFQGAVNYDDGTLFIRILHITDAVSTTCDSASDAEESFRDLVDDYIETCKEVGVEPNKPFKGTFNVRVKPSLHRDAAMAAAAGNVTLNSWVERAIREKLEPREISPLTFADVESDRHGHASTVEAEIWVPSSNASITSFDDFREMMRRKQG